MKLKFINRNGKEQVVGSLAELIAAVRDGELSSDTLVFDEQEQRWKKSSEIVEFHSASWDVQMPVAHRDASQVSSDGDGDSVPPTQTLTAGFGHIITCPLCSHENPTSFGYCGNCGNTLTATPEGLIVSNVPDSTSCEMDDTPTPPVQDAVAALDEPVYASMTERFGAYVLDSILIGLPFRMINCPPLVPMSCFVMYRFVAHLSLGTTVGKYIVGIEVVQEPGKRMPRPLAMFLRDTVGFFISFIFLGVGYWWGALSRNGKAWSDIIGGTIVRERKTDRNVKVYCWGVLGLVVLCYAIYYVVAEF